MRKIICSLLFLLLFTFINIDLVDAKKIFTVPNEERDQLLTLGFTEQQIDTMSEEEYNINKGLEGKLVSSETKYYKIFENNKDEKLKAKVKNGSLFTLTSTSFENRVVELDKERYFQEITNESLGVEPTDSTIGAYAYTPGYDHTSYKTMNTYIYFLSTGKYRVYTSVKWDIMPLNKDIDVIGTAVNSAFWTPVPGSQYGKQSWVQNNFCNTPNTAHNLTYGTSSSGWNKGASAYTLKIDLPNNEWHTNPCISKEVIALDSYAYYTATNLASTTQIDAFGKYMHQETTFSISPSITFYPISFSVTPTQESSFTSTTTHAVFTF